MAFFNHNLTGAVTKELLASGYGANLNHDFSFNNNLFGLFIKLGASTSKLDAIIT